MLLFIVFRNFLYFAQSHGSFDTIAFLLAASRSHMPFFNSELIQGPFFYSSASSLEWNMRVNNIQFCFPVCPQNIRIIRVMMLIPQSKICACFSKRNQRCQPAFINDHQSLFHRLTFKSSVQCHAKECN